MASDHDKAGRQRVIWVCKCGVTRTLDYATVRRYTGENKWGSKTYAPAHATRTHADGVVRSVSHDIKCACGRDAVGNDVRGRVTAHTCGAKCLASKGPVCECSCGGRNHGSAYC